MLGFIYGATEEIKLWKNDKDWVVSFGKQKLFSFDGYKYDKYEESSLRL